MYEVATVKDLLEFLKKNFKEDDKLCYWHEGGAWMECEHIYKSQLGIEFMKKLEDHIESHWASLSGDEDFSKEEFMHFYDNVGKLEEYVLLY